MSEESEIRSAIIMAVKQTEPPNEPKGADYWTAFFADRIPHDPPPLPLKPVTVWRYADGRYTKKAAIRRPWYERECIRCKWLIVPLQKLAKKMKNRRVTSSTVFKTDMRTKTDIMIPYEDGLVKKRRYTDERID